MTTDLTARILVEIRDDVRSVSRRLDETRAELSGRIDDLRLDMGRRFDTVDEKFDAVHARIDETNARLDRFQVETAANFAGVRAETAANFAGVLHIIAGKSTETDRRLTQVEDHLGLER